MRGIRMLLLTTTIGAMVLVSPSGAAANGGAYLELDRTYYLAGDAGHGVTYVSLPARKEHLLDEGPFHVFALPRGVALREGHPIPPAAIRLGTVAVIEEDESYELETDFIVPDLDPGWYEIGVCNDPCTISGFRESLGGSLAIVETRREAQLLTANDRLRGQLFGARREVRRAERPSSSRSGIGTECRRVTGSASQRLALGRPLTRTFMRWRGSASGARNGSSWPPRSTGSRRSWPPLVRAKWRRDGRRSIRGSWARSCS